MAGLKKKFESIAEGVTALTFDPLASDQPRLVSLPIEQVEPDPDQPRKDLGDLTDLMASIKEHGILQPCIVSVVSEESFRLIAGERRFSAAKAAGLKVIPCIVRTIEEHRRLEVQLIENIHRKELSPIEEAETYRRLMTEFHLTQRDLAKRLGKSLATVNQTLRILSLPDEILRQVPSTDRITRSVLLEIAKMAAPEDQIRAFKKAASGELTVKVARSQTGSKEESDRAPSSTVKLKAAGGEVTIRLSASEYSTSDLINVLEEVLSELKAK